MSRTKDGDFGRGTLVLWGDDGLEEADALEAPEKRPAQEEAPFAAGEAESSGPERPCAAERRARPAAPRALRSADPAEEGIVRVRPKVLPRRQRSTFSSEDDFCNDPEELERRSEAKKARRAPRPELSVFARAVAALARREHSKKELREKLLRKLGEEREGEIDEALERLEKLGYLSDERFAEGRARVRAASMGDARIKRELIMSGVSPEKAKAALDTIGESEEVRAWRVWRRRFSALPADRRERDRQVRYLLYRGFSMNSIERVLRGRVEIPDGES
ncbi:MAG: Regulatory protein RecX [Burkholderia sp.]|jgi:regulatory protein